MTKKSGFSDEIEALGVVLDALSSLDDEKRAFVYKMAGERLGIVFSTQRESGQSGSDASGGGGDTDDDGNIVNDNITPKDFMRKKNAKTDVERIACLAFYLTHHRGTGAFKTKEVTDLNTEAALPKLSNASQSMKNATNQNNYLASAGKGNKQITALGEDVVNALPDHEKVAEVLANSRKPKRRKKRVAKKKAVSKSTRKKTR